MSTETIVVIGHNHWGRGTTLPEAKKVFQTHGGKLGNGYAVLTFDGETEFLGVDWMGSYSWVGNEPTIVTHPARKARK